MSGSLYFAYGERTPEVLEAIIGRYPTDAEPAVVTSYGLHIQRTPEISDVVKSILGANRTEEEMADFAAYVAVPQEGARIPGIAVGVSPEEMELLDNYDIEGLWLTKCENQHAFIGETGRLARVVLHALIDGIPSEAAPSFDDIFPPYLSDPARTHQIAEVARQEFVGSK